MKDNLLVRKYINNGNVEIRQDDNDVFIRLTKEVCKDNEVCDVSVDFKIDSMYEIITNEVTKIYSSFPPEYSFGFTPEYIKLPLRFDSDGSYMKIKRKFKKMTKEEIEKELGYKIDIVR